MVLIMTDSQRYDMIGRDTPCLELLATEGVRFESAYCVQPLCTPARSALFTGLYPHENGCWANGLPLGATVKTVPQRLSSFGIHCAHIGKWHLDGADYFGLGKAAEGWDSDYWFDMRNYLDNMPSIKRMFSRHAGCGHLRNETFAGGITDRAIDFLGKFANKDFFLTISYDEPHHPYVAPDEFRTRFAGHVWTGKNCTFSSETPPHQKIWNETTSAGEKYNLTNHPEEYLACNNFVDAEIGRVLDAIANFTPDAVIVYTSDHGDFVGNRGLCGKGPALYDEITRVPLFVKYPGIISSGTVCRAPVSHIDIPPFIMDYFTGTIPAIMDGESITPLLHGESKGRERQVFMEYGRFEAYHDGFGGFQPLRGIFDGRYKLTVNLLSEDELYDLKNDPGETVNVLLHEQYQKIRNCLHDELLEWQNRSCDPFRGYYWRCRPWRTDATVPSWHEQNFNRQSKAAEDYTVIDYMTGLPEK